VACDHYRRWADDLALMRELGVKAYRFGLGWARILPDGLGSVNRAGIGFYDRLVDALLVAGIEPVVTLYHWDMPAALDDRGGWLSPDSPGWFTHYARAAFEALGDRVRWWATLNEPWVVMDAGYLFGFNAPGHRNRYEAPIAMHHMLLAHAEGVRLYRSLGLAGRIGIVVNLEPKEPATGSEEDRAAAARDDAYNNQYHLDPVFFGRYPQVVRGMFGEAWPGARTRSGANPRAGRFRGRQLLLAAHRAPRPDRRARLPRRAAAQRERGPWRPAGRCTRGACRARSPSCARATAAFRC
jgi:beta-glucosidase